MPAMPSLTRKVSNVPIYHNVPAMYPSSPLLAFPSPTPCVGRPLAERAGITLRIKTSTLVNPDVARAPAKNAQPHRTNLPRRRNPKRMNLPRMQSTPLHEKMESGLKLKGAEDNEKEKEKEEEEACANEKAGPSLSLAERYPEFAAQVQQLQSDRPERVLGIQPEQRDAHLQELIPGLYLAFANENDEMPMLEDPKKAWTHIVNVTYPPTTSDETTTSNQKGSSEQTYKDGVQRLNLVLPASASASASSSANGARPGLGLTDAHLRTVRDFIAQALPAHLAASEDQSTIFVLVTAPHARPTDAISAAACYLAYASGRAVEDVLRFVDEEVDFLSVWKGEVSDDECERVQRIAKAWSWLDQIKPVLDSAAAAPAV